MRWRSFLDSRHWDVWHTIWKQIIKMTIVVTILQSSSIASSCDGKFIVILQDLPKNKKKKKPNNFNLELRSTADRNYLGFFDGLSGRERGVGIKFLGQSDMLSSLRMKWNWQSVIQSVMPVDFILYLDFVWILYVVKVRLNKISKIHKF